MAMENMGIKLFRFYNFWTDHQDFKEVVLNSWRKPIKGTGLRAIYLNTMRLKHRLKRFNRDNIGDIGLIIRRLRLLTRMLNFKLNLIPETMGIKSSLIDNFPDVVSHFVDHFRSYLGSPSSATGKIDLRCIEMGTKLSVDQQLIPLKPFSHKEIRDALFSIPITKSPGHDGFGSGFFKALWQDIGGEVCTAVGHCFETEIFLSELHVTTLSLVPKVANPSRAVDYRPIACCSTLYKCISKLLCSRWIMVCLKNTTYPLLMNGRAQGSFKGEKGLRQGDPMSPLLFVLIMEYLTRSLQLAAHNSTFRFHPMCKSLKLLNLCFADDLILFCKGTLSAVRVFKEVLEDFSAATGLSINASKSHIFFGEVNAADRRTIAHEIQLSEGSFPLKYLGVPMKPTKWKHEDCDIIIQKIRLRLHSWTSRHLYFVGRMQLIHSVLFGLRNYWMSIFVLPQSIIKEVEKLFRGFLWGISGSRSKIHIASWQKHDILWVKWVNSIYLKGSNFWNYNLNPDCSWYWRKLCHMRGKFSLAEVLAAGITGRFKASKLYNSSLNQQSMGYHQAVWCKLFIPKHQFLLWHVVNSHLLTRDNMLRFNIKMDCLLCPVCGDQNESHTHLFFECCISKKILDLIFAWMGYRAWPGEFTSWTIWIASSRPGIVSSVINLILAAVIYYIWRNRNRCIFLWVFFSS
ncbi:uncharacterized protein LOC133785161 [Humulus lupulus]|uniref:uncharacterized protein LOC133785161 n=1 Tax=Humulus lupulus TaxID=3486 RepID=UPI002B415091|nr:uncharacterized protein LOC133785161 [Humulus lupulus]